VPEDIFKCRICESIQTKDWKFKEMMFGLREEFSYKECLSCGCIQIEKYPEHLEVYYPHNYYSLNSENDSSDIPNKATINRIKKKLLLYNHLVFNNVLKKMGKHTFAPFEYNLGYLKSINLKPWSKILDIGCGKGDFLLELYNIGFCNLTGIDKFIKDDFSLYNRIPIFKKSTSELKKKFDLITMHHVLEHMPNQKEVLMSISKKMKKNGNLIIRIPVINEAWKIYKQYWVQIDAPRHFYLHSLDSFHLLANSCGFEVRKITFDSYSFQFWGSEQYRLDISLKCDKRSLAINKDSNIFCSNLLDEWKMLSSNLNKSQKGDQAIFYLKKK